MSALSGTQDAGFTTELDFHQAMQDFTEMFPHLEFEVIEAVLRANHGAVDSTIDHLLTMVSGEGDMGLDMGLGLELPRAADDIADGGGIVEAAGMSPEYINTQNLTFGSDISPSNADELRDIVPELPPKQRKLSHRGSGARHMSPPSPPTQDIEVDSPELLMDASITEIMNLPPAPPVPTLSPLHGAGPGGKSLPAKVVASGSWQTPPQPIPGFVHGAPSAPVPKKRPSSVEKVPGIRSRSKSMPVTFYKHMNPVRLYSGVGKRSRWEPLLLGDLPEDFLRLDIKDGLGAKGKKAAFDDSSVLERSSLSRDQFDVEPDPKRRNSKDRHKRHHSQDDKAVLDNNSFLLTGKSASQHTQSSHSHQPATSHNPTSRGHHSHHSHHQHHGKSRSKPPQPHHPAGRVDREISSAVGDSMPHQGETTLGQSGDWLTARLVENERRRNTLDSHDTEMAQYLQDEYLALVLQNSEFLEELTRDKEFMQALTTAEAPSARIRAASETHSDMDVIQPRPYAEEPQLGDTLPQSSVEGYGQDNQNELSAFPHDCDWGAVPSEPTTDPGTGTGTDTHVELRKQLENMGTSSRKKLADVARRFFSRKKKQPGKPLYKNMHTPSTMNLLLEEEVPEHNLVQQHSPS